MKWARRTHVFDPRRHSNQWTHGMMPKVGRVFASSGIVEVVFGRRDAQNRSHIHRLNLDVNTQQIVEISEQTMLGPGIVGAFDDAGVSPGSLLQRDGVEYLYFTGWNRTQSVPFNNSIGIARRDGNEFKRLGHGPILTRSLHEPFSVASPFVSPLGNQFVMWYSSMDEWADAGLSGLRHRYDIKIAFSSDGVIWRPSGLRAISYSNAEEYAFGCNCVVPLGTHLLMWYPYRGSSYRIGFASSSDGIHWTRSDSSPLTLDPDPASDWDAEMVCYPCVFWVGEDLYMLYNGDGFGRTGFGLAKLDGELSWP